MEGHVVSIVDPERGEKYVFLSIRTTEMADSLHFFRKKCRVTRAFFQTKKCNKMEELQNFVEILEKLQLQLEEKLRSQFSRKLRGEVDSIDTERWTPCINRGGAFTKSESSSLFFTW